MHGKSGLVKILAPFQYWYVQVPTKITHTVFSTAQLLCKL